MGTVTAQKKQDMVSVIMPTFNEPPHMVCAAIESILAQTYREWELLIYDDSTDPATRAAIDAYRADGRVKVYRSEPRLGFVPSLNRGLEAAQGKYIARMDGDDIAMPYRFEKEVQFLQKEPGIQVVGGQLDLIDDTGRLLSHRRYPAGGLKLALFACVRNPLAHPTVMFRRELVEAGYRYDETLKMSEDLDLWLRIMNDSHKIANLQDTLLQYRVRSGFTAKRTAMEQRNYMAAVRKKNFDKRRPLFSLLSCTAGWLFTHVPAGMIQGLYRRENGQTGQ